MGCAVVWEETPEPYSGLLVLQITHQQDFESQHQ